MTTRKSQRLLTGLNPAPTAPATLLVGFTPTLALAVARSLHRRGVRVLCASFLPSETPLPTQAIERFFSLPGLNRPTEEFDAALRATIAENGVDLVIPLTDSALLRLLPRLDELRAVVRVAAPNANALTVALDKDLTACVGKKIGLPLPRTMPLSAAGATFPLVAKFRQRVAEGRLPRRITDATALREFTRDAAQHEGMMLQEFVPGDDVGLAIMMHEGRRVAAFQYRALKTWPAECGICVLARTEAVDPRLLDCSERLLHELAWEGLAQIDFRHDRATGRFALLEINGRFWGTTAVAIAAGVDFPRYVWELAHGIMPQPPAEYRAGLHVRSFEGDVRRLIELTRRRTDDTGFVLWREVLRFIADTRPGVRGMFWSWRDPRPGFHLAWVLVRCWLLARSRNFAGRRA